MKKIFAMTISTLGLAMSVPAFALGPTVCKQGKLERTIEIVYAQEGKKVPCEVKYTRDGNDQKTLYTAQAKEGFCEEKATEFAGKLSEKGWNCSQVEAAAQKSEQSAAPKGN